MSRKINWPNYTLETNCKKVFEKPQHENSLHLINNLHPVTVQLHVFKRRNSLQRTRKLIMFSLMSQAVAQNIAEKVIYVWQKHQNMCCKSHQKNERLDKRNKIATDELFKPTHLVSHTLTHINPLCTIKVTKTQFICLFLSDWAFFISISNFEYKTKATSTEQF